MSTSPAAFLAGSVKKRPSFEGDASPSGSSTVEVGESGSPRAGSLSPSLKLAALTEQLKETQRSLAGHLALQKTYREIINASNNELDELQGKLEEANATINAQEADAVRKQGEINRLRRAVANAYHTHLVHRIFTIAVIASGMIYSFQNCFALTQKFQSILTLLLQNINALRSHIDTSFSPDQKRIALYVTSTITLLSFFYILYRTCISSFLHSPQPKQRTS